MVKVDELQTYLFGGTNPSEQVAVSNPGTCRKIVSTLALSQTSL